MHHRLGGPLPRQLANAPQIHLSASCPDFNRKKMPPLYLSGISRRFHPLSRSHRQVVYVLLTRSPLLPDRAGSVLPAFDLHVLGMPPAFILSQDQTLHLIDSLWTNLRSLFPFFVSFEIDVSCSVFKDRALSCECLYIIPPPPPSVNIFFYFFLFFFNIFILLALTLFIFNITLKL